MGEWGKAGRGRGGKISYIFEGRERGKNKRTSLPISVFVLFFR